MFHIKTYDFKDLFASNFVLSFLILILQWFISELVGVVHDSELNQRHRKCLTNHIYMQPNSLFGLMARSDWKGSNLKSIWLSSIPMKGWCRPGIIRSIGEKCLNLTVFSIELKKYLVQWLMFMCFMGIMNWSVQEFEYWKLFWHMSAVLGNFRTLVDIIVA